MYINFHPSVIRVLRGRQPPQPVTTERRAERHCPHSQTPSVVLSQPGEKNTSLLFYTGSNQTVDGVKCFVKAQTFKPCTCVCFFGSGATDLETLLTSLWTSVKILFRFSTFSFFALLICKGRNWAQAGIHYNQEFDKDWNVYCCVMHQKKKKSWFKRSHF